MTITCAARKPFSCMRADARKRRSMTHGVCSNNPGRSTRITPAPLRCCPGLTTTLMSNRSMAIISVPLRSIAPLNWRRQRCTSTPACHKLALNSDMSCFPSAGDDAIAEFERAFTLNPNFFDPRFALALTYAGEHARAIEVLEANIRLDPFQPHVVAFTGPMGFANYMLKRYGEAVRWLRECASRLPNLQWPHLLLPPAYAHSGQIEEA